MRTMNDRKYAGYAYGLMAAMLLGAFLPRIPAVKAFSDNCPLNPLSVFWCAVALTMCFLLPRVHIPGRLRFINQISGAAFSGAVIFLALRFCAGFLLQSIAASPYDLSPKGVVINLFNVLSALIAREMVRAYALGTAIRNSSYFRIWIPVITFLLCLLDVNLSKLMLSKNSQEWFVYIAKDILPLIAQSCLLTTLVLCGGAKAGILYAGTIGAFTRVFPFLPSLPWIAESALGVSFPVIMALSIWGWYKVLVHRQATRQQESVASLTVALVLIVSFSWFVTGVFPIYPSVILTGSMEPVIFPGDVVLIQKFSSEKEIYSLAENDVINFKREDIMITHRIIAVNYDQEGNISFLTKGDNNKSPDEEAVLPGELKGIIKGVVPKVGTPVLWLYTNEPIPEGVLDD